jgi:opacity protein-like surface antigen
MDAAGSPRVLLRPLAAALALVAAAPAHAATGLRDATVAADADRQDQPVAARRMYATAMIGSSVGESPARAGGPLVAGQGACGVAVPRSSGDVRLELEVRRRQPLGGGPRPSGATAGTEAPATPPVEEWTTMANVWRDLPLTQHFGVYAGGGIGVGVRRPSGADTAPRAGLGWQAGAGVTYAGTERVTFDVGYRFSGLEAAGPRTTVGESELLFAIRIDEPFRGLWRDTGR